MVPAPLLMSPLPPCSGPTDRNNRPAYTLFTPPWPSHRPVRPSIRCVLAKYVCMYVWVWAFNKLPAEIPTKKHTAQTAADIGTGGPPGPGAVGSQPGGLVLPVPGPFAGQLALLLLHHAQLHGDGHVRGGAEHGGAGRRGGRRGAVGRAGGQRWGRRGRGGQREACAGGGGGGRGGGGGGG